MSAVFNKRRGEVVVSVVFMYGAIVCCILFQCASYMKSISLTNASVSNSRGVLRGVKTCHIQAPTVKCHKTINRSGPEGPELTQIPVQKECYERTKEIK